MSDEQAWLTCAGPCEEAKPVFAWFYKVPVQNPDPPNPENADPYCWECARHRLELETFPVPLEDIPIQRIEDPFTEGGAS